MTNTIFNNWRNICAILFAILSSSGGVADELPEPITHHTAVGVHGMAVFVIDGRIFASHMPLHHSIHAKQLIIELALEKAEQQRFLSAYAETKLFSILPEVFDLELLAKGSISSFKGDIFDGHFEREGKPLMKQVEFHLVKVLLNTTLSHKPTATNSYYIIPLDSRLHLLVHQIGLRPSFDQIILISIKQEQPSKIVNSNPQIVNLDMIVDEEQSSIKVGGLAQEWKMLRQIYFETEDFRGQH